MTDVASVLDALSKGGLLAGLLVVLVGGAKQWWVFGWQFEMMRQDRDQWRSLALHGSELASKAVETLAKRADNP